MNNMEGINNRCEASSKDPYLVRSEEGSAFAITCVSTYRGMPDIQSCVQSLTWVRAQA